MQWLLETMVSAMTIKITVQNNLIHFIFDVVKNLKKSWQFGTLYIYFMKESC